MVHGGQSGLLPMVYGGQSGLLPMVPMGSHGCLSRGSHESLPLRCHVNVILLASCRGARRFVDMYIIRGFGLPRLNKKTLEYKETVFEMLRIVSK